MSTGFNLKSFIPYPHCFIHKMEIVIVHSSCGDCMWQWRKNTAIAILHIWTIIQSENAGPALATKSKEFICNAGAALGQEDALEQGITTYSTILCLENPMDRVAWWAIVQRVTRVRHDWGDLARMHKVRMSSSFTFLSFH